MLTSDLRKDCVVALRCVEAPRIAAAITLMRNYNITAREMRLVLDGVEGVDPLAGIFIPQPNNRSFTFDVKGNARIAYWSDEDNQWVIEMLHGDPLYGVALPPDALSSEVIEAARNHPMEETTMDPMWWKLEFPWGEFDDGGHWRGEM
jgi:hypothetical protein